jgi:hypothetical protein
LLARDRQVDHRRRRVVGVVRGNIAEQRAQLFRDGLGDDTVIGGAECATDATEACDTRRQRRVLSHRRFDALSLGRREFPIGVRH